MPTHPLFYLIGVPAVFLISLGRGAFGGGLAILGVPQVANPVTATFMMARSSRLPTPSQSGLPRRADGGGADAGGSGSAMKTYRLGR